jgi:hypothetical protein
MSLKEFLQHQDLELRDQESPVPPFDIERQTKTGPSPGDPSAESGFGDDVNDAGRIGGRVIRLAFNDALRRGWSSRSFENGFHRSRKEDSTPNINLEKAYGQHKI